MEICSYGCGKEAKFFFKNGNKCCSKNQSMCPEVVKKILDRHSSIFYTKENPVFTKVSCKFCQKEISIANVKVHENFCYLNPINLKLCSICNKPIKNYKHNKTCSCKCARSLFSEMYAEFGRNNGNKENGLKSTYTTICFSNHKKECIICSENNIVGVHHYDKNHNNDLPENLLPMCPTHHQYMHSKFKDLINEKVERYREEWIKTKLIRV